MLKNRLLQLRLEQLSYLVRRDIKRRYKDTALGLLWIVITPLIQSVVISFVFVRIIGIQSSQLPASLYPFIVLSGLTAWNYISHTVSQAMVVFTTNRELVQNQPVPLLLLPLTSSLVKLFDFMVETGFLLILLVIIRHAPGWEVLLLIPFTFSLFLFVTGLSFIFSLIYLYVRDVGHVVSFILSVWFWLSPIFFPAEIIPDRLALFNANPMIHILAAFRNIMLYHTADPLKDSKLLALSLAVFLLGGMIFNRYAKKAYDTI